MAQKDKFIVRLTAELRKELEGLARQRQDRRLPDQETPAREAKAWETEQNAAAATVGKR